MAEQETYHSAVPPIKIPDGILYILKYNSKISLSLKVS